MIRILLIASIVLSLGSAVLGFLNRDKLVKTIEELVATQGTLATTQATLATTEKNLSEKTQELASVTSERDQLNANLAETRSELAQTKEEKAKTEQDLAAKNDEVTAMRTDMEAKDAKIAELELAASQLPSTPAGGTAEGGDSAARVAELQALNDQLTQERTAMQSRLSELQAKEKARQTAQVRQGLQGTVLAVNQAWNFVVLSLGDRSGLVPNAELLVKRGPQLLGKVRVTSVEPSTSIADIVLNSLPRGMSVMPGDTVIYQGSRD